MALGSDISGITTIDRALAEIGGRLALAHAILRRLTTPRGGLWYWPSYGYDLLSLIGSTVPVSIVEHRVQEQVTAEEEVLDATTTATFDANSGTLRVEIRVVDGAGPFSLTIEVDEQSKLTAEALADGVAFFKQAA